MRFAPALLALVLASGCYIQQSDPQAVARKFADSISGGQPGSAFALTSQSFRDKHSFDEVNSHALMLAPCKGKIVSFDTPLTDPNESTFRYKFNELCGNGFSFQGVDVRVGKVGDRWQVISYLPQALQVVG